MASVTCHCKTEFGAVNLTEMKVFMSLANDVTPDQPDSSGLHSLLHCYELNCIIWETENTK